MFFATSKMLCLDIFMIAWRKNRIKKAASKARGCKRDINIITPKKGIVYQKMRGIAIFYFSQKFPRKIAKKSKKAIDKQKNIQYTNILYHNGCV